MADALLAVGSGMADLGVPDPRKLEKGSKDYHPLLDAFLKSMRDRDDPATRSYPANTVIIRALYDALDTAHHRYGTLNAIAIDLIIVAFYWLLRPAEYLDGNAESKSQAFRLCDIYLTANGRQLCATDPSLNEVADEHITYGVLTFTDQKNGVRGEQVGHKATNDPQLCPCKALSRLARRLRAINAPKESPMCTYRDTYTGQLKLVKPTIVTNALRHAAAFVQDKTGIDPVLLSARSLRPGGATALLCAGVDKDAIQLLGRWKSDAMLRYLRIQAYAVSANFAQRMLDHGGYTFAPGTYKEQTELPLPVETPADFIDVLHHTELDT